MQHLLDELETQHGVDPADGLQLLTPVALCRRPFDPGVPVLLIPTGGRHERPAPSGTFEPPVLPGRHAHGADPAGILNALYPPDHPLTGLAGTASTTVGEVTSVMIEDGPRYLPALAGEQNAASSHGLAWLVARLRAPDGCPWDREQDHRSLRKYLLEEAYEVYDALDQGSTPGLAEELGDLLLQVVLHAQYAAEAGVFDLADVQRGIMTKIVRRHPHVFGDVVAESAADVIRNWEEIKAGERARHSAQARALPADGSLPAHWTATADGSATESPVPAAFAGLSRSLPALAYAQEIQERAAALGYDWPSVEGVLDKVAEESRELAAATSEEQRREEMGDLLLVLVNLARRLGIDAEASLRGASAKFAHRFAHVERLAAERDIELRALSLEQLDELWQDAKVGRTA